MSARPVLAFVNTKTHRVAKRTTVDKASPLEKRFARKAAQYARLSPNGAALIEELFDEAIATRVSGGEAS